jgi:hypothetical protein
LLRLAVNMLEVPAAVRVPYYFGSSILLAMAGLAVFLFRPTLLLRQMYVLAAVSIGMSLLQINGIAWAQSFGSAVEDKGLSSVAVFGATFQDAELAGLLQTRPDGFTHANNLTSQLLLLFYTWALICYLGTAKRLRAASMGLGLIAFACALNGGKVVVLGVLLVQVAALLFVRKRLRLGIAVITTGVAYAAYYILFPGVFITNFNPDLFVHNASDRVVNLGVALGTERLTPLALAIAKLGTGSYIPQDYVLLHNFNMESETQVYSGWARLGPLLPFAAVGAIALLYGWRTRADASPLLRRRNMGIGAILLAAALSACLCGGPFYQTIWFCFFAAPVFAPWIVAAYRERFATTQEPPR